MRGMSLLHYDQAFAGRGVSFAPEPLVRAVGEPSGQRWGSFLGGTFWVS